MTSRVAGEGNQAHQGGCFGPASMSGKIADSTTVHTTLRVPGAVLVYAVRANDSESGSGR